MVIISVLVILGVMMVLILQLSGDVTFATNYLRKLNEREKAYYIACSALSNLPQILSADTNDFDSSQDIWALELPPIQMGGGTVSLTIEDEERKFDVLGLLSGSEENQKKADYFRRLLEILDMEPGKANAIMDWMDDDATARIPGGSEGFDYRDPPCKNAPLDSISELLYIPGIEKEDYYGRVMYGKYVKGLRDLLTIYSSGMININTAPRELIMSLDDEIDENLADEILRRRVDKPFEKMEDLVALPGFNMDLLYRIKYIADTKSNFFKATAQVQIGDSTTYLTAVVKRNGNQADIIFWKVE